MLIYLLLFQAKIVRLTTHFWTRPMELKSSKLISIKSETTVKSHQNISDKSQQILILGTGYFAEDNNLDEDTIEITAMYTNTQKPDETDAWGTYLKYK